MNEQKDITVSCPVQLGKHTTVQLAHGGGGTLMQNLIEDIFLKTFNGTSPAPQHDSALLPVDAGRLAFTTDSYVVHPLFFPGGDIGSLAVNGTVNDLAMSGAKPLYLSAGFILEEGLPLDILEKVAASMQACAAEAGVKIITGDTKVVDKGKGDGLFINTAGIGFMEHDVTISPAQVQTGDAILLNGDIGRHGTCIMSQREGLEFEGAIESDCAPLHRAVEALLNHDIPVHCLRDLTRGGLSSALCEIAQASQKHIHVDSAQVPVSEPVRGACEILGLDPFYVANEGRMIVILPAEAAEHGVGILERYAPGTCQVGEVTPGEPGQVTVKSEIGTTRILDMLSGEQLPRIC